MAQLPDENKNNESIMDNYTQHNESKQIDEGEFNDNDSLKPNVDMNEYADQDIDGHHAIIQTREDAPPPYGGSGGTGVLTHDSLNKFDQNNPPNYNHGLMNAQRSDGANSSNPNPNLGLGIDDIMGGFGGGGSQQIPDFLVQSLIEMGFSREKSVYALQHCERQYGDYSVDTALQWLFDNPDFKPPDTSNIVATIGNMLGGDHPQVYGGGSNNNNNVTDPTPPNNSPDHADHGGLVTAPYQKPVIDNGYPNNNNETGYLYQMLDQAAQNMAGGQSKSKSGAVYSHNATLGSAATHDEQKANDTKNINNNDNTLQKPTIETKNDEDDLQPLPASGRIHHQATTSTVASEMTEISQLSTGVRSQSPSINNPNANVNTNTNTSAAQKSNNNKSNTNTKDTIAQLYMAQQILEATNRNTVSNFMIPHDIKMVIVVRKDLGMKAGKVAAQCCHGCLGVVMDIINGRHITSSFNNNNNNNNNRQAYNLKELLDQWRMNGEKKIVLQCPSEDKLLELKQRATINNLPNYLVTDAGHTQIAKGSKTVLAIGPYPSVNIDEVTGGLKLY